MLQVNTELALDGRIRAYYNSRRGMADPVTRLNEALGHRYRAERELGAGSMAAVCLAEELKHDRDIAIKVAEVRARRRAGRRSLRGQQW